MRPTVNQLGCHTRLGRTVVERAAGDAWRWAAIEITVRIAIANDGSSRRVTPGVGWQLNSLIGIIPTEV